MLPIKEQIARKGAGHGEDIPVLRVRRVEDLSQ